MVTPEEVAALVAETRRTGREYYGRGDSNERICNEAADALERLQAENVELREDRDHWHQLAMQQGMEELPPLRAMKARLQETVDYCYAHLDRHSNPLPCNAKHLRDILEAK